MRGDLLTSCNGKTITYDAIGNPTNDGEWNYAWEKGRQLSRMSKSGTSWTFTYDANGLRTGRKNAYNSGQTYQYQYSGGLLRSMQVGNEVLAFDYDANGTPLTVTYNGAVYHYVTNLQGDVVQILDKYGSAVAWYTYDAWGNTISNIVGTANVGLYNPLRYRGYVYDRETGLYYLQSRYYNPEWGRFINADDPAYLGADGTPVSYNLYAYCGNNPVNCADPTGNVAFFVVTAIIGAVIGVGVTAAVDYIPDKEFNLHWGWYVGGGLAGAAIGAGVGMAVSYYATGSILSSTSQVFNGLFNSVSLYRSVGPNELADLKTSKMFKPGRTSMEGKFFAKTRGGAAKWATKFNQSNYVKIRVAKNKLKHDSVWLTKHLDAIDDAFYFSDLDYLNSVVTGIWVNGRNYIGF